MSYHVGRDGRQLGVFSLEDIRSKLASGEFHTSDLGWTEGMAGWKTLGELVPEHPSAPAQSAAEPPPQPLSRKELMQPRNGADSSDYASSHKRSSSSRRRSKPENHLVGAILATLFCCLPFGVVAIVYASQVDTKHFSGDYHGARQAAQNAQNWMWISFGVGLITTLGAMALTLMGAIFDG